MKLSTRIILPALVAVASAATKADVYLFQHNELRKDSNPPTLTPEQARLVFAQRLGVSQYHGLGHASDSTLSYVNKFGGQHESLFQESSNDKPAELVVIVDGVSPKTVGPSLDEWTLMTPAFRISNPPSVAANSRLGSDLSRQIGEGKECQLEDAINPFESKCWNGKSKIIHIDLLKSSSQLDDLAYARLVRFAKDEAMNVLVVLMPESSRLSKVNQNPYGSYAMPQQQLGRRQTEEPMTELPTVPSFRSKQLQTSNSSSNGTFKTLPPVPKLCYESIDKCMNETNNCSGHGECYKKRSTCFACGCKAQNETFTHGDKENPRRGIRRTYWGGSACQKKDVSGPFWLILIFSVVMIGLVGWAISMLFNIGEEKLPGVIGAGVLSNRAR